MNHTAVKLVQDSWTKIEERGSEAAVVFHGYLLKNRPWLTALYQGYVDNRNDMVLKTFSRAVHGMHDLESHAAVLLQIGRVSAECGVQSHHYPYFEVALSQTLEHMLGDEYSGALKAAWSAVFGAMTRLMLAGADGETVLTVAIRQHTTDRRSQRRRSATEMGGNRGYHRRAGWEFSRRYFPSQAVQRAALAA